MAFNLRQIAPPPMMEPKSVPVEGIKTYPVVIFSIESTGFHRRNPEVADHILHMGAVRLQANERGTLDIPPPEKLKALRDTGGGVSGETDFFSIFLKPKDCDFTHPNARRAANMNIEEDGHLYFNGNAVSEIIPKEALEQFCSFLGARPVVLYGHNVKSFACDVLLHAARECGMLEELSKKIKFVDTKPLMKRAFSDFEAGLKAQAAKLSTMDLKMNSFSFENLFLYFFREVDKSDALGKAKALSALLSKASETYTEDDLRDSSFTLEYVIQRRAYNMAVEENLPGWQPLVDKKIISSYMAKKAAGSGLSFEQHVLTAFQIRGESLVREVLAECRSGQARVTRKMDIIDKIVQYIKNKRLLSLSRQEAATDPELFYASSA